jgi:hypothetical protein
MRYILIIQRRSCSFQVKSWNWSNIRWIIFHQWCYLYVIMMLENYSRWLKQWNRNLFRGSNPSFSKIIISVIRTLVLSSEWSRISLLVFLQEEFAMAMITGFRSGVYYLWMDCSVRNLFAPQCPWESVIFKLYVITIILCKPHPIKKVSWILMPDDIWFFSGK